MDGVVIKDAEIYHGSGSESSNDDDLDDSLSKVKIKPAKYESDEDDVVPDGCEANWIKARDTPIEGDEEVIPKHCVIGGKNYAGDIFIAKISDNGSTYPGKVIPSHKTCYSSVNGKQIKSRKFELLSDPNVGWYKFSPKMKFPKNITPIIGGYDKRKGHSLFIGKKKIGEDVVCGKVDLESKKLYIVKSNRECSYSEFDLLVSIDPGAHKLSGNNANHPVPLLAINLLASALSTGKKIDPRIKPAKLNATAILNKNCELISLNTNDKEYKQVETAMQSTINSTNHGFQKYNIKSIKKIINKTLNMDFERAVINIKEENNDDANIKWLFHGSTICDTLAKKGFDERHSKTGGMYGRGVYFADVSSKSSQYSTCSQHQQKCNTCKTCVRSLLYCEVALGKIKQETAANNKYVQPPPHHHSVMGVASPGVLLHNEYIVYRGEQAIPRFLIEFNVS